MVGLLSGLYRCIKLLIVMKINKYLLILFGGVVVFLTSCTQTAQWRRANGATWGTEYHITYKADRDLADSIIAEMRRIDMGVSAFNKESNICRINSGATDLAGREFADLFECSKRISAASHGAFDPTVYPLVKLWGFGADAVGSEAPDSATVRRVLRSVGMDSCYIDAQGRVVRKSADTQFDFGAIAKGYGVDAVALMLERNGCADYMVEIGGEVRVGGLNTRGDKWHLQIDDPLQSGFTGHERLMVVKLTDCSVATSGNYRNVRTLADGSRVWHTISPVTGYPVESSTLSVTVVAPTCAEADAIATACMAMKVDDVAQFIENQPGVSVLMIVDKGRGEAEQMVFGKDVFRGEE